jgi:Peptidase family M50
MTSGGRASRTALGIIICAAVLAIICELVVMVHGLWIERFLWLALGLAIGIACHELGHMLCAAIVSIPIRLITIGVGPLLWCRRFGETWFELRLLPFSGFVAPYPAVNSRWYRWALFLLGGALGNAAVVCLVAGLDAGGVAPKPADETFGPVVLVQLYLIVVNLVPFRARIGGTRTPSDGLRLLQLLWGSRDEAAQLRAAYATALSRYNNGNLQPRMNSDSSRILYNMTSFQLATDEDSRRDFREALLRELESGNLLREEKMFVLDGLVTDGLISGDPAVGDHLDEWSLHALALGPELPTLLGSRGAVLVELGRYEAAKALLEPLVAAHQGESFDSLMNQAFLARAERALGDSEAARRLANAARSTSNALQATPRMTAMLSRLEAQ